MQMDKRNLLGHSRRLRPVYALFALSATTLMLATGSCKKNTPMAETPQNQSAENASLVSGAMSDEQIDAMITQFYNDMKTLKDRSAATDNMALPQAVLNIEAVYNKYVVVQDYTGDIATGELTFKVPAHNDGSGSVNMKDVANAFWAMKEALLAKQSSLTENGVTPTLESFDLEAMTDADGNPELTDGNYTLKAFVAFARPGGGNGIDLTQNDIFTNAATHCWRALTSTDPLPGEAIGTGQATIDHSTKFLVPGSENYSLPSAPSALRAKGIYNFNEAYGSGIIGYAINISSVGGYPPVMLTLPAMPAGTCDYVTRNVPSYDNNRVWHAQVYNVGQVDDYDTYKHWLTTPMMNFYVAPIKNIIHLNIAPGKQFYDFHINLNIGGFDTDDNGFIYSYVDYWYYVYSCKRIPVIPLGLGLSKL